MRSENETTLVLTDAQSGDLVARKWRLVVVDGPDAGLEMTRDGGTVVVGSHGDADLVLQDPSVSRYHAEVRLLAEGAMVVDLESRNGTRLGSVKIDQAFVGPGGVVRFGRTSVKLVPLDAPVTTDTSGTESFGAFVTRAATTKKVLGQLRLVAETDATVLLEGETGTGKELLARALHDHSRRKDGPFVVVDCSVVAPTLLESQLFGHLKGAYTDATQDRPGAFEAANGGTVFLDELGELPIDLQPKLLRVLEARTVRRLGDVVDRPVDVRFVAATNRDLESMIRAKQFREDLYYRVAVVRTKIAPLRDRPDDIALLASTCAERISGGKVRLAPESVGVLEHYDWPGNARELRNIIERALAISRAELIRPEHLFPQESAPGGASFHEAKDRVVAEFEARYVRSLLARHQGNVSSAAREAGISRNALYSLMKRAGVDEV